MGCFDEHRAAIAVVFGVIGSCATALGPVHFKGDEGAARHFEIHDGYGFIGAVDGRDLSAGLHWLDRGPSWLAL